MPHKMKGYVQLESYVKKKREEAENDMNDAHVRAAVERKHRIARMSPAEVGKLQAVMYATSMYLAGFSGERVL